MLINRIRDAYREFTGRISRATPITTVTVRRPAANAGNLAKSDMQARRHRRQRRLERVGYGRINGWTVRTW
jgi:hypothetical protein